MTLPRLARPSFQGSPRRIPSPQAALIPPHSPNSRHCRLRPPRPKPWLPCWGARPGKRRCLPTCGRRLRPSHRGQFRCFGVPLRPFQCRSSARRRRVMTRSRRRHHWSRSAGAADRLPAQRFCFRPGPLRNPMPAWPQLLKRTKPKWSGRHPRLGQPRLQICSQVPGRRVQSPMALGVLSGHPPNLPRYPWQRQARPRPGSTQPSRSLPARHLRRVCPDQGSARSRARSQARFAQILLTRRQTAALSMMAPGRLPCPTWPCSQALCRRCPRPCLSAGLPRVA